MEATARVAAVAGGWARLVCDTRANCGACGAGRGCALRWLSRPGAPSLRVPDRTDDQQLLAPGQTVIVEADDGEVLRAAVIVYLPSLAGLLTGALLARLVGSAGEGGTLAASVLGAFGGLSLTRFLALRKPPRVRVRRPYGTMD